MSDRSGLKIADLITRFTYYPSLTIDERYRINYRFDLDFNLRGDWFFRIASSRTSTASRPPDWRETTMPDRTPSA